MGRIDYKVCRICGGHASEVGELSHNRLCSDCGVQRKVEELAQLHLHHGPHFDHWRERLAASVGAFLPERLDTSPDQR